MTASVLLCADSESVLRPELMGLSGERLDAQDWLSVFAEGLHARAFFKKSDKPTEAWVVSSDDVDSINLAAALKRDAPRHRVFLVAFRSSGSLKSRVSAAGIDGLLDRAQFVERYRSCKLVFKNPGGIAEGDACASFGRFFGPGSRFRVLARARSGRLVLKAGERSSSGRFDCPGCPSASFGLDGLPG